MKSNATVGTGIGFRSGGLFARLPGTPPGAGRNQAINYTHRRYRFVGASFAPWAAGVVLWVVASPLWALGLGDVEVRSHLNEPLAASIEMLGSADGGQVTVRLADRATYVRLGLGRSAAIERLQISIESKQGRTQVLIAGQTAVTEVILDLVVILAEGDSEQLRHYPLLLDFPSSASAPPSVAQTFRRRDSEATRPPPAPAAAPAASSGKSYGPVRQGETLGGIASLIKGKESVRYRTLVQTLFELNPDAFIDNDINKLKVGAVLQIPSLEGLSATTINRSPQLSLTPAVARQGQPRVSDQGAAPAARQPSRSPSRRDSRLELIGTPNSTEILNSMNQLLEEDDVELVARAGEARRNLAFAAAEIQTYRQENELLREQVKGLESRVADLNRLVELRAAAAVVDRADRQPKPTVDPPVGGAQTQTVGLESDEGASAGAAEQRTPLTVSATSLTDGRPRARPWYLSWQAGVAALVLLVLAGVLIWLRGQREDQLRQERTADLVNRIRQAADRGPL